MRKVNTENDFWNRINKNGPNGCWIWLGVKISKGGYGHFNWKGKIVKAHRLSYELSKGEIPNGLLIRHLCNNPICVNPDHLLPGTHQENMDDKVKAKRQAHGKKIARPILQEEQVNEIIKSSESNAALGRKFNVSSETIRAIRIGKSWNHFTGLPKR